MEYIKRLWTYIQQHPYHTAALVIVVGSVYYNHRENRRIQHEEQIRRNQARKPQSSITPPPTSSLTPTTSLPSNHVQIEKSFEVARRDIVKLINEKNCGPILIRLAWNDAGTFDKDTGTGGPHATMRFESVGSHSANHGLDVARNLLAPLHAKYPLISTSDFWQFAAATAIEAMGGPHIPFNYGRSDDPEDKSTPEGRLPDPTQGVPHLRSIFSRMGFNGKEIVALFGAHTIGSEGHSKFDNSFFVMLVSKKWTLKEGSSPPRYEDESKKFLMLPIHMALLSDEALRRHVERYAASEEEFFKDFVVIFQKMQELGCNHLNRLG